jgi:hypothetical protein
MTFEDYTEEEKADFRLKMRLFGLHEDNYTEHDIDVDEGHLRKEPLCYYWTLPRVIIYMNDNHIAFQVDSDNSDEGVTHISLLTEAIEKVGNYL